MKSSSDSLVVAELRRRLFKGELPAGAAVNIANVADDLGVSTAPVRDALMKLSERGLISRVEGRGFFVSATPDSEASELLEILHQILVLSIEKGHPTCGLKRWCRGEPAKDSAHDELNVMLEAICSPTVAAIAISIADRLWDLRRRIAQQNDRICPECRLARFVARSLARANKKKALYAIDTSFRSCQRFLISQIVWKQ
jgi:DNA-binding transcriptional regulator YhcF (GntR family)